ncbi:MAG: NAD(P)/FAD-dependent oxidoreductase [Specibacter sp.]
MAAQQFGDTIIIGAGQAGLSAAHHLERRGIRFRILSAEAPGETWMRRWDSLRLFTPAQHCGLPGMPFPARKGSFPTKDEVAAHHRAYAATMPVTVGVTVTGIRAIDGGFELDTTQGPETARTVIVAVGAASVPFVPAFATRLSTQIRQLHSNDYKNEESVPDGGVLVVGAGTSGVEIALELAPNHPVWLAGRTPFHVPNPLLRYAGGLYWQFIHRVLTLGTPLGRKVGKEFTAQGGPLIGVSIDDALRAGVSTLPRLAEIDDGGLPAFPGLDGLEVATVVWATGHQPDFSWIAGLPLDGRGWPATRRGEIPELPGLYFLGMPFQYGLTSSLLGGVGRDAGYVAERVAKASQSRTSALAPGA